MFFNLRIVYFRKKYAIADLVNTIGSESFVEVSVAAHNWIRDDGSVCLYSTYLPPKKQAIAIKDCMTSNPQFTPYPATIRYWFDKFFF